MLCGGVRRGVRNVLAAGAGEIGPKVSFLKGVPFLISLKYGSLLVCRLLGLSEPGWSLHPFAEVFDFLDELVHVAERPVDRGEAYISHLVDFE